MFDGLYAMAMDDLRQCAVEDIRDAAFNAGQPLHVNPVYETGENWPYVWTRDTAYAALLSLAAIDPQRTVNSLLFKTAHLKPAVATDHSAAELHIVQDTGTGGSYPVSSDRVTWALGAGEALKYLHGKARESFAAVARATITNTIEIDRTIVYDDQDGLYRGETSFLDWREQTYPVWVKDDLAHIASSKALSTNVAHYACISLAASLARQHQDQATAAKYEQWARSLRQAIVDTFYVDLGDGRGMYAATKGPLTDPSILRHYDLLGSALAVLVMDAGDDADAASRRRAEAVVATYPHAPLGPPVIHPQHPSVPIYHNSAIWPFVTAVRVANWKVVDHGVWSLMRASALHLSNMENLEFLSGETFVDAGPLSGPVVNSRRQLWSVAGYLAMVHDAAFGLQTRDDSPAGDGAGIRFEPFVTRWMRESLLRHSHEVVLEAFAYRGKRLRVRITLPAADQAVAPVPLIATDASGAVPGGASVLVREGAQGSPELWATTTGAARPYRVVRVTVNGRMIAPNAWLGEADLLPPPHTNEWAIALEADDEDDRSEARVVVMNVLGGDREAHYAPREPTIAATTTKSDGSVRLCVERAADDDDRELLFDVYRDGVLYAERVGPDDWTEDLPRDRAHSYSAQAVSPKSGLTSRHSRSLWLSSASRGDPHGGGEELVVEARDMRSNGGMLHRLDAGAQPSTATTATTTNESAPTSYYCFWGDRHHRLVADDVRPARSGAYAVQVLYSNGAGTRSTGIACALKWLVVDRISGPSDHEGERTRESRQVVAMPQNSEYRWDDVWNWSTPARVHHLRAGCRYAITLCDDDNDQDGGDVVAGTRLMNMSYLDHFTTYTNNGARTLGGGDGPANFANIARIRLRSL